MGLHLFAGFASLWFPILCLELPSWSTACLSGREYKVYRPGLLVVCKGFDLLICPSLRFSYSGRLKTWHFANNGELQKRQQISR